MAEVLTLNIDSSTAWDLAVPSESGMLQQTSGVIAELPAIASGFSVDTKEQTTATLIPSLELANFREGSTQPRPIGDNGGFPTYVDLPLSGNKLQTWLNTYTPESTTSSHLYYKTLDRQGWTYITDFTLHPYTPYVKEKDLPFEYYLHGRIRHDGKLELAFFSEICLNVPSAAAIELADITFDGGGELAAVHTLQYTCGNQTLTNLRIAGKEEAERYMLSDGKLIMSRCPIFLGTLMHSGKAIYETKTVTEDPKDSVSFWPVVNFLGHMWSYWGVIADNVLYIVGLPVYNGSEQGHIHSYMARTAGILADSCYFPANVPPTMPCDFPYGWGVVVEEDSHFEPVEDLFGYFNSTPPASTQAVRDAYKKACNSQPYIYGFSAGWYFANHSMAITAAELLDDNMVDGSSSVQYELTKDPKDTLASNDTLAEGINMPGFLVGAEGGAFATPEQARLVQCVDGYDNPFGTDPTKSREYGWLTGVLYNDAGLQTDSSEPAINRLNVKNNVTTGFVSVPAIFPDEYATFNRGFLSKPTAANVKQGWIIHAFNVLQQGNTYTIWTSSWDGAFRVLSDTTEDPYIDPPIDIPPNPIPGPGPGPGPSPIPPIPTPPPEPPDPGPGPDPGPSPDPDPDPEKWTESTLPDAYKYVSGSNVRVTQVSQTQDFVNGRQWTYQLYIEDYKLTILDNMDLNIKATATPRDAGTYTSTPNSTNYTWKWGISSCGSQVTVGGDKVEFGGSPPAESLDGTIEQAISMKTELAFNMAIINSRSLIKGGNTVNVSQQTNDIQITIADYSSKTRYKQTIKTYSISRASDGNLKAIIMGSLASQVASKVSATISPTSVSGSITGSSGVAAPGVNLQMLASSYNYSGSTATADGPCPVNSVYAEITPTPSTQTVSVTGSRTIGYGPDGNQQAVASINGTATITVTGGTISV